MKRRLWILTLLQIGLIFTLSAQVETLFNKGVQEWEEHRYDEAVAFFSEVIRLEPGHIRAYKYRASSYEQLDMPEKAALDYLVYLNEYPDEVEVILSSSLLNYHLQRYEQAIAGFEKLLRLPPGETGTILFRKPLYSNGVTSAFTAQSHDKSYIYNYLGMSFQGLGETALSLLWMDSAITVSPETPDYYVNRGTVYMATGQEDEAIDDFRYALQLQPDNSLARYNLAVMMEKSGDNSRAEEYFSTAIEANPESPYAYRQRGYRRMLDGQHAEALADFNAAIALDPGDAETFINRGIIYQVKGEYEKAISDYSRAIELAPDLPKGYLNRGNALYKLRRYQEALNEYNVALIYNPDYSLAYYQRAITFFMMDQADKACIDLQKAEEMGMKVTSGIRSKLCKQEF